MTELQQLLEQVSDKESFLQFVTALAKEQKDDHQTETSWQNATIEHYLEAATAWAIDSPHAFRHENTWKNFAEFLYMGKIYE